MGDPFEGEVFPRWVLWVAGAIIAAAILLAGWARLTGFSASSETDSPVQVARSLFFLEQSSGEIVVKDASSGEVLDVLEAESEQFIRGVLRSLRRERTRYEADLAAAYRVSVRRDGQVLLEDLATGQRIDLRAYGPTNVAAFMRFLEPAPNTMERSE